MSKSLIRKNQLHPDIADLVSGFGANFFISSDQLNLDTIVHTTGEQTIDGVKSFVSRPLVNGTGVLLQGEAAAGVVENVVYTTGNQTINGVKSFGSRPLVNGIGVLLQGEAAADVVENVVYTTGNQTISGIKNFASRPTFNSTGLLIPSDLENISIQISGLVEISGDIVYLTGNQTISGVKTFTERPFLNNSGLATTGDLQFNGFRPITANVNGFQGITPSGNDIITFLNNVFYPFIPASINLNSFSTQELGTTTTTIPFIGTINTGSLNLNQITNVEGFVNNNARIPLLIPVVQNFNWSVGINLNSTSNNVYVKASGVNQNNNPIQIQSNTRSIVFEAPSYAGSGIDNLQNNPGEMKTGLSTSQQGTNNGKLVIQKPSSIQMQVYTNNNWFYFVYPNSWGALSNISNPQLGNFSISTDFVTGAVTLTLANGSSHSYRYYKRSLPTTLTNYPVIYTF